MFFSNLRCGLFNTHVIPREKIVVERVKIRMFIYVTGTNLRGVRGGVAPLSSLPPLGNIRFLVDKSQKYDQL